MTTEGVVSIRRDVARLRLLGADLVLALPTDTLAKCYNGTGPEFLPAEIRHKLDELANPFLPAVMVHDVEFEFSDGSVSSFHAANLRLLINCLSCARASMPWYSWRRYVLILEAYSLYRACQKFGWIAWLSAFNKNKNQKGNHE